jgi:hypothetical protein
LPCHAFNFAQTLHTQDEEERYARCLIQSYAAGLFELPRGQTLRFFIATKLRCSPMRVTKKFPGSTLLLLPSFRRMDCPARHHDYTRRFRCLDHDARAVCSVVLVTSHLTRPPHVFFFLLLLCLACLPSSFAAGSVMKQSAVASSSSLSSPSSLIHHIADAHQLAQDFMGSQEQAFLASIKKHGASNNVTSTSAESIVHQISNNNSSSSADHQSGHNMSKKKKKATTSTKQQQHGRNHPHRISPTASAEELPVTTVSSLQLPTASTSLLYPTASTQSSPAMLLSHWNNIAGLVNHNNNMGAATTTPPAAPLQ